MRGGRPTSRGRRKRDSLAASAERCRQVRARPTRRSRAPIWSVRVDWPRSNDPACAYGWARRSSSISTTCGPRAAPMDPDPRRRHRRGVGADDRPRRPGGAATSTSPALAALVVGRPRRRKGARRLALRLTVIVYCTPHGLVDASRLTQAAVDKIGGRASVDTLPRVADDAFIYAPDQFVGACLDGSFDDPLIASRDEHTARRERHHCDEVRVRWTLGDPQGTVGQQQLDTSVREPMNDPF